MKPKFPDDWGPEKQLAVTERGAGRRPAWSRGRQGLLLLSSIFVLGGVSLRAAQTSPTSLQDKIAAALVAGDSESTGAHEEPARKWDRAAALRLEGMADAWYNTAHGEDYRYVKRAVDVYVDGTLTPAHAKPVDASMGRAVLLIYRVTLHSNYYEAATLLREVAEAHCGIAGKDDAAKAGMTGAAGEGCDDAPFLAEYAAVFQDAGAFAGITGALERWDRANLKSGDKDGQAREARAIVDSLAYYPDGDAGRVALIKCLSRIATEDGLASSFKSGDSGGAADRGSVLVYAMMKGARLGYLPEADLARAKSQWGTVKRRAVHEDAAGKLKLDDNTGALLVAAAEAEHAETAGAARGKIALVDAWFNSQERKNAAGQTESFHYKWTDEADSGYSLLGHMLRGFGMVTRALPAAPTAQNLREADYYFIASPDIPVKNPNPHYVTEADAARVAEWVKQGGVLVMMENDPPNADIDHLNLLADKFGIHFENVLHHHILGEQVEDGTIPVTPGGPLFEHAHTLYMKDTCAISLHGTGEALLRDRGDIVMAAVKYGRGTVFAAVDPWLYNEYTDGRKNPKIYGQFDNFAGGMEFVRWLVEQRPRPGAGVEGSKKAHP